MLEVTRDPAEITEPRPIVTPEQIKTEAPIQTSLSMWVKLEEEQMASGLFKSMKIGVGLISTLGIPWLEKMGDDEKF